MLGLLASLTYIAALKVGFFSDDFYFLGRTTPILERPSFLFHIYYRDFIPVVHASFLLDWLAGGMTPWLYHLSSILIHGLCTVLVFAWCRSLGASRLEASAGTLAWALNVHISETVIWAAARGHSLATLFLVAALLSLAQGRRLPAAVILFCLALGAKETALFPIVLVPFLIADPRRRRLGTLVFGVISVAFVLFNLLAKPELHLARGEPIAFVFQLPFLLLRPLGLSTWYNYSPFALILVLFAFLGLVFALRRRLIALIGLLWIAASLVPVVLQPVYTSRYFYLLSVGFALVICGILREAAEHMPTATWKRTGTGLALLLLILTIFPNVLRIQEEITDYRMLCEPYSDCVESFREAVASLPDDGTLVVLDIGQRSTIAGLTSLIDKRPTLEKLIPYRKHGIDGLIAIEDLLNVIRERSPGRLGTEVKRRAGGPRVIVAYDGQRVIPLRAMPEPPIPAERIFTAKWDSAEAYFQTGDRKTD